MAKAAILGCGTVGSGVLEIFQESAALLAQRAGEPLTIAYVLVRRVPAALPDTPLFVTDLQTILDDPEVTVAAECIGGVKAAYPYVKACLQRGVSVCTSNKELVATYGAELLALARAKQCAFLFEAAVGGGMPVIAPLYQCLSANRVRAVRGILNGTTNFMLTKMERDGMSFAEALHLAQQLGYAETVDPGDDVDGRDACRKIAILASMMAGRQIPVEKIPVRGIRGLTVQDMAAAKRLGCAVKLIAWARLDAADTVQAGVEPMLVPLADPLAEVNDVFNGVTLTGDRTGDTFYSGRGAGKLPTASAVVADMLDAVNYGPAVQNRLFWTEADPADAPGTRAAPAAYYVRAEGVTAQALAELYSGTPVGTPEDTAACLTACLTPTELDAGMQKLKAAGGSCVCLLRKLENQS